MIISYESGFTFQKAYEDSYYEIIKFAGLADICYVRHKKNIFGYAAHTKMYIEVLSVVLF